jgi:hypothetical protein
MLKGYFTTDWSHLWLPYNGKYNQIRVDRERYIQTLQGFFRFQRLFKLQREEEEEGK